MDNPPLFDFRRFNRRNVLSVISRFGTPRKLRILYLSTYHSHYTRTESLLALFGEVGLRVRAVLLGESRFRYAQAVLTLLRHGPAHDVIFVAFRGQEILPVLRMFTSKPIVFDAFVSVYDTLCLDRGTFQAGSVVGRSLRAYDRWLCGMSDVVLVDTRAHQEYFKKQFGVSNVEYLYVGCNEDLFAPQRVSRRRGPYTVFWYGTANPVQGVEVVLQAAKLLEGEHIRFRLVGPVKLKYGKLLSHLAAENVDLADYVPYKELPAEINMADLCLGGHFSLKGKATRVIAGKTFQFLACAKPTIIGDNPANRELFIEGDLVHFVPMGNPSALADKVAKMARQRQGLMHS
jgi:glycosyltransferase involved in cell wall biosynthesis